MQTEAFRYPFRKTPYHQSSLELEFIKRLDAIGAFNDGAFLLVPQYSIDESSERFDFMFFPSFVLVECQGGLFLNKSAHTNGARIVRSHRKYNKATMQNYPLFFVDSLNVQDELFLIDLVKFIRKRPSYFDLRTVNRVNPSMSPTANFILSRVNQNLYNPIYRAYPQKVLQDLQEGFFFHTLGGIDLPYRFNHH